MYWSPTLIAESDNVKSMASAALLVTVPAIVRIPVAIIYSGLADRRAQRLSFTTGGQLTMIIGIVLTAITLNTKKTNTVLVICSLAVANCGWAMFWNTFVGYQSTIFPNDIAALAFAFVNTGGSFGNILGTVDPIIFFLCFPSVRPHVLVEVIAVVCHDFAIIYPVPVICEKSKSQHDDCCSCEIYSRAIHRGRHGKKLQFRNCDHLSISVFIFSAHTITVFTN